LTLVSKSINYQEDPIFLSAVTMVGIMTKH